MRPQLPFDPRGCDFIIVRNVNGFCRLEPWKLGGRLESAMHGVVEDLLNARPGDFGAESAEGEFALGFIAAIDVLARGNLRLVKAQDRSELSDTVRRAFRAMHGKMDLDRTTDLMTDACEKIVEHDRDRGRR